MDFKQEPGRKQLQLGEMRQLMGACGGQLRRNEPRFCEVAKEKGDKEYNGNFLKLRE